MIQLNHTWLLLRLMFVLTLSEVLLPSDKSRNVTWMGDGWVHEALSLLNWVLKEPWDNEEPEPAESDLLDSLLPRWFSSSLKLFCHRSRQWCWMLTDCLMLWTEGLTSGDDDFGHDLEEPNLTHSNDLDEMKKCFALMLLNNAFSFSMKMNLKITVMKCIKTTDVFDKEEVDVNDDLACDEGDMLDIFLDLVFPPWRWRGSLTSPWWGCDEQLIEEQLMQLLLYQWVLPKVLDIPEAVMEQCRRWNTWCEMIDSKLVTTESSTLARGKD